MENEIYIEVLLQLAKHKYLTRSLFYQLEIKISRNHFSSIVKRLSEKGVNYIGQKKFGYNPEFGKVEDVFFLKPRGKKYLMDQHKLSPSEIDLPIGNRLFYSDYFHRIETIKIRIAIEKSLNKLSYHVLYYDQYFSGRAIEGVKGRQSATLLLTENGHLKADSSFLIMDRYLNPFLFCLEYHNGREVKRIVKQMGNYVQALKIGSPSLKYDVKCGCRILNIFRHESTMKCLMERLDQDVYFAQVKGHFLFITLDEFYQFTIFNNWKSLYNPNVSIFGIDSSMISGLLSSVRGLSLQCSI